MKIRILLISAAAIVLGAATMPSLSAFATGMDAAMARMHDAMMAGYIGDPDRDFARMMIPHHQGAVDMAEIELRYGKDERLRRLAQGIIVEQRQEIAVMRDILANASVTPADNTSIPQPSHHHGATP